MSIERENDLTEKSEEQSNVDKSSDLDTNEENSIPDEVLEKRIFFYGFGITAALWLYIIIWGGSALYFILPAIFMTLVVGFLFIRFQKRKASQKWVEYSFSEYKESQKKKRPEV
ncbi:hypothetical protein [Candidatus Lokiarchaeum ossiferum]|uniref:hypothetical protein n=1 Tax=Candidatus Lokiarchaeum ossiferum TaxID=2951803 RepID=UPI00352F6821